MELSGSRFDGQEWTAFAEDLKEYFFQPDIENAFYYRVLDEVLDSFWETTLELNLTLSRYSCAHVRNDGKKIHKLLLWFPNCGDHSNPQHVVSKTLYKKMKLRGMTGRGAGNYNCIGIKLSSAIQLTEVVLHLMTREDDRATGDTISLCDPWRVTSNTEQSLPAVLRDKDEKELFVREKLEGYVQGYSLLKKSFAAELEHRATERQKERRERKEIGSVLAQVPASSVEAPDISFDDFDFYGFNLDLLL